MIGLTSNELGLCQSLDADLAFLFAWLACLEGEKEPEEGVMFLANPAVKNYPINQNLFLLDVHKVLRRKGGETAFDAWSPGTQAVMTSRQRDTRG